MTDTLLIQGGRVVDPASGFDQIADIRLDGKRVVAIENVVAPLAGETCIDARGCMVVPGLVDLAVRLREPGHEHAGMLETELHAAVAGGVAHLVCLPDTDPVLDEPGLVEMLTFRAQRQQRAHVHPLGALTRGLRGEVLTEMSELRRAGCIGFSQAEVALADTQVLQRALQYAASFGFRVWLRPQERHLGKGVAASGALATRLGLSGVPVAAETIALFTLLELVRATGAPLHVCRLSSAAGVDMVRQAKAQGLPVTADVSVQSLHLTDMDIGFFDSRARLAPPLRQQADRDALRRGLADGTLDALVSDHTPVADDEKTLPFAEATPGATAIELLLSLALKWSATDGVDLRRMLTVLTHAPGQLVAADGSIGRIQVGGRADLCIFDPKADWQVLPQALHSQSHATPFAGQELPGRVRHTVVDGRVVFSRA